MKFTQEEAVTWMVAFLENMRVCHSIGDTKRFYYYAGKANALRDILEEYYNWDERYADEHTKAMWDIMDAEW